MKSDVIELAKKLISFPTVSSESNLQLIEYIADFLANYGFATHIQKSACGVKANLVATLGPMKKPGLVFSGHTDVVPVEGQNWSTDPFLGEVKSGKLYGRGACDMKGFIATLLANVTHINAQKLLVPIIIMLSYDEEVGCGGAKHLISKLDGFVEVPPLACIIGEPSSMKVVNAHKGIALLSTKFKGTPGHSSSQKTTVSAISAAARLVCYLDQLPDSNGEIINARPSTVDLSDVTINVGEISGGTSVNIVPEHAQLIWEFRYFNPKIKNEVIEKTKLFCEALAAEVHQLVGFDGLAIDTEILSDLPPLTSEGSDALIKFISDITSIYGSMAVNYCTEAGLFQKYWRCPTVVCGPGSIEQAHRADEYVELTQLQLASDLIEGLIEKCYSPIDL